jgi:hypothetical protein
MSTLATSNHRRANKTAVALRQKAAGFARMARDCRDALISDELRLLAHEFHMSADELEAFSPS